MSKSEIYDLAKQFQEELTKDGVPWVIKFYLIDNPTVRLDSEYTVEDLHKILAKLTIIKCKMESCCD